MRLFAGAMCCTLLAAVSAAAELNKETVQEFERYTRAAETRLEEKRARGPFLWTDESPERPPRLREGQIAIEPWSGKGDLEVSSGLIHDWIGAVFLPGVTLARTLASVQDYDHHKDAYKPEVIESRLLSRNGNEFKVYMRLRKKKVITVVLDTEHEVQYFQLDSTRWYSRSYSTKIAEVENPYKPDERQLPAGAGHGFLWRLYSYWKFQERDGGVYVECRALSLTRNVPLGLGWLIEPIVRQLPRESLANTLRATCDAVLARAAGSR